MKKIALILILIQLTGCSFVTAAAAGAIGGATIFACKEITKIFNEEK